jgi:hypothetical protein
LLDGERDMPLAVRRECVIAEDVSLCNLGATLLGDLTGELEDGQDHYVVALLDPEGNEFDIN